MAEKCTLCTYKFKEDENIVVCETCGSKYHDSCWNRMVQCDKCGACTPLGIRVAEKQRQVEIQAQEERQQEKEQNNTEVKSNQEDCVNHESTNQPKTNISVQHEHSKKNIVSGIVFIVLGVIMILHSTGRSGGFAAFGGDFYTEIHEQVSLVVSNLHSIAIILKDGFGFLFIGLGVDRLIKK